MSTRPQAGADAFTLLVTIDYLTKVIIGGLGSILGAIFGAIFMTLRPEVLKLSAMSLMGVYPNAFGLIALARASCAISP